FDGPYQDHDVAVAGYERHNADVVDTAPPERLLSYRPGDGWGPLCEVLGLDVPDVPFPHTNTTDEFRSRAGMDS
ncbi:MAG: sulfotransferase, partial [Ilumatobacteraceae bacterium]